MSADEQPAEPAAAAEPAPIASTLTMPDKKGRAELFRACDVNGNGGLSLAEIDKAIVAGDIGRAMNCPDFNHKPAVMRAYKVHLIFAFFFPVRFSRRELFVVFQAADTSGDGFIERKEFYKLLKYLVYFNNLWHKFEEIDSDHDRRIDIDEFATVSPILHRRILGLCV